MSETKKEKKEVKKERKDLKRLAAQQAVTAVASRIGNAAKPKKKDSGFMSFLKGAAGVASDLLPLAIPFLLANHGPTRSEALKGGMTLAPAGAPLAPAMTMGNLTGEKDVRTVARDSRGNSQVLRVRSCDFVTALPAGTYNAGDVVYESWISPLDPAFEGTKFAQYGGDNERWQLNKGAFIFEPTQPATQPGALAACVFNDPDITVDNVGGAEALRAVSSQEGADTFTLWSAGVFSCPKVKNQPPLFTSPNGTDVRLCTAGKICIVAASAIGTISTSPGNLYFVSEVDYMIPSLSDAPSPGDDLFIQDASPVDTTPDGSALVFSASSQVLSSMSGLFQYSRTATFVISGTTTTGSSCRGLSAGTYLLMCRLAGTVVTAAPNFVLTDAALANGVTFSSTGVLSAFVTGSAIAFVFMTVPPGVDEQIFLFEITEGTATSATAYRFYLIAVNDIITTGAVAPLPASPSLVPRTGGHRMARKRLNFFLRTRDGVAWAQGRKLDILVEELNRLRAVPQPLGPPGCSYTSFGDCLPRTLTEVAKNDAQPKCACEDPHMARVGGKARFACTACGLPP